MCKKFSILFSLLMILVLSMSFSAYADGLAVSIPAKPIGKESVTQVPIEIESNEAASNDDLIQKRRTLTEEELKELGFDINVTDLLDKRSTQTSIVTSGGNDVVVQETTAKSTGKMTVQEALDAGYDVHVPSSDSVASDTQEASEEATGVSSSGPNSELIEETEENDDSVEVIIEAPLEEEKEVQPENGFFKKIAGLFSGDKKEAVEEEVQVIEKISSEKPEEKESDESFITKFFNLFRW